MPAWRARFLLCRYLEVAPDSARPVKLGAINDAPGTVLRSPAPTNGTAPRSDPAPIRVMPFPNIPLSAFEASTKTCAVFLAARPMPLPKDSKPRPMAAMAI